MKYLMLPCNEIRGNLAFIHPVEFIGHIRRGQAKDQYHQYIRFTFPITDSFSIYSCLVNGVQQPTVAYSRLQYSTVQSCKVQYSIVQISTIQYITVQYSKVQYSTVQYSTQYSTVQYSTVQYSTRKVQYSTVDYIRVE